MHIKVLQSYHPTLARNPEILPPFQLVLAAVDAPRMHTKIVVPPPNPSTKS